MKSVGILSIIFLGLMTHLQAQEISVSTLANGACWFDLKEDLKIVSFNDKEALHTSRDNIELQFRSLLNMDDTEELLTKNLLLHCGGYGSSLVVKTKIQERAVCAWLKIEKGELKVRSVGGFEESKSVICDGYKWGELVVTFKDKQDAHDFVGSQFAGVILKIDPVVGNVFKITLNDAHHGKEAEVLKLLQKDKRVRAVEFNNFQHPVGDFTVIK